MTNEEAREVLVDLTCAGLMLGHERGCEAIHMAINALEKMDIILPLLCPDIDPDIALEKIREAMYHGQI